MAQDFSESSHMESDNTDDQDLDMDMDMDNDLDLGMEALGRNQRSAESRTLESQRKLHEVLDQQIAEFLARGGTITQVESTLSADRPKKAGGDYGSRPI
ncbi:hypothetical protein [Aestuariirhabdus litorea]|uniref:Transcriptional regulator SutA RNAP-binding domain-containing protein n=1 Tax=Aestuariirhabdus litorea TaxID=2528527 RepID=A0A3P3VJM0_9GAMM|nr:hypothetical protein [Aestuariirhabdus litorea]RRJ82951.1 hypothetical protein D0544_13965 [Aestuariirhabdus litorea]RWW93110.1 hypothetical protein DZC74_13940 [Endozoicomonadaceae bacterium GTF-13]